MVAAVGALLQVYPQYNDLLLKCDQFTQDAVRYLRTNGNCLVEVLTHYNLQKFTDGRCNFGNYSFFDYPPIVDIFGKESLLMNVSTLGVNTPTFPRLLFQARGDEIVPFNPVQQYVNQQCAHGANVQFAPLDVNEHVCSSFLVDFRFFVRMEAYLTTDFTSVSDWQTIGELVGAPGALNFIRQAFEGQTPQVKCGTAHNFLTLDNSNAFNVDRAIGKPTADALRSLNGTMTKFPNIPKPQ